MSNSSAVMISTPMSLTTCTNAQIPLAGGTPPYQILCLDNANINDGPILVLGPIQKAGTFIWNVNITAGTTVVFEAVDSTGTQGYASPLKINQGTSTSCIQNVVTPTGAPNRHIAKTSISTGAIIGIAVGCVLVVLVIITMLFLVRRRDRRNATYHGPRRPESVAHYSGGGAGQHRPSMYGGLPGTTEKYSLSNMGSTYQLGKH